MKNTTRTIRIQRSKPEFRPNDWYVRGYEDGKKAGTIKIAVPEVPDASSFQRGFYEGRRGAIVQAQTGSIGPVFVFAGLFFYLILGVVAAIDLFVDINKTTYYVVTPIAAAFFFSGVAITAHHIGSLRREYDSALAHMLNTLGNRRTDEPETQSRESRPRPTRLNT